MKADPDQTGLESDAQHTQRPQPAGETGKGTPADVPCPPDAPCPPGLSVRTYTVLAIVALVVTVIFLIVLASNVAPWLRGPKAWRWPYAIPGTLVRLWLPTVLLVGYIALAWWLQRGRGRDNRAPTRGTVTLAFVAAMGMTPAIQLALLYMDHPDVRSQLFYRAVAEGANGFFNVGAVVMDRYDFMRYFAERMISWYPTHPERHPPGLPVLFSLARQFFDASPALTARLNDIYRPYQCQNVALMNLPDGAIASATLQMAIPLLLSLVVPPLYLLGKEAYDRATGLRAVLLWPLVPGIALWAGFWTPIFALFTVLSLLLVHYGLSRHRLVFLYLSGLVLSISVFLSFGNAALAGYLGLYALFWLASARLRPKWTWLLGGALIFALGTASLWIWLWFRFRLDFFAVWRTAIGRHLEMDRTGWFWILYHLYDFYIAAAGIPILVFWVARTWDALRGLWTPRATESRATRSRLVALDVLALCFFVGLLLMDLSGAARGEVARVWAFLLPLPLLIAVYRMPRRGIAFLGLIAALSLQLFVTNIYVRYIGTDLIDPPPPPAQARLDDRWTPWQATWEEGIALQAIQLPPIVPAIKTPANANLSVNANTSAANAPVTIRTVWSTSRQIHRPYTVFVHMLDEQGQLVAQRDAMPLDNGWPTTCWRPGAPFEDQYSLVLLKPLAPGTHRVEIGLYWLPSGERLPVSGQGAQPNQTVAVGTIEVVARK